MKNTKTQIAGFAEYSFEVDDAGRVHSAQGVSDAARIQTAGTLTFPLSDETAQKVIANIADEIAASGEQLPEVFQFRAGQLFYSESGEVEEARMIWETTDAKGKTQLWKQQQGDAPTFIDYKDGQFYTDGEKQQITRRHLSAVIAPDDKGVSSLYLLFDFPQGAKALSKNILADESLAMIPNNKADLDFQHGLRLLPKRWGKNEEKVTRYFNGKGGHVVEYQPSEVEKALGDAPERALTALDERFNQLKSEIVADVIDILFHHWHATKDPQTNAATINAAKLCEYRNKTLSGDNLELHWHALKDAFSFTLRETSSDLKARVFFSESEGESTEGPGAKYIYSPGFMLQYALKKQPLYFAPFLQKVWALDPVRENEAKRLARYLRADWRMNTQDYLTAESGDARAARWHTWAFLLAEAGIDVENYRKKANGKPYPDGPRRLIETIARAVETLYQMEVIAEGDFDIYHPSDRKAAENLPARGKLDVWLALRVCLAPSAALREALLETDNKRRAGRARDAKALATESAKKQLRARRDAKAKSPSS